MRSPGVVSLAALLLTGLMAPHAADAQALARGSFAFVLEDEQVRSVEFSASTDARGFTTGSLTFNDEAGITDADPDDPREGEPLPPSRFYVKAAIDGLKVEKNRALMSGTVVDSSHKSYIGSWVQYVVEDNETNLRVPDRLTWTFCQPRRVGWVPSDAEWDGKDDGAYLSWWATDAERKDDRGIPSVNLLPKEENGCPIRPLFSYEFVPMLKWDGDIIVQQ